MLRQSAYLDPWNDTVGVRLSGQSSLNHTKKNVPSNLPPAVLRQPATDILSSLIDVKFHSPSTPPSSQEEQCRLELTNRESDLGPLSRPDHFKKK